MPFKFVNLWQTNEERKAKYYLALCLGASWSWARVMRDWRLSKIERFFHVEMLIPFAQASLPGFFKLYNEANPWRASEDILAD